MPKIIHQIWGGAELLPVNLAELGETWKEYHPDWKYEFWDDARSLDFIQEHYPQYIKKFKDFTFNVQRWDAIRFLILYKMGGMYMDFDTQCLASLDELIADKICWFSLEPLVHAQVFDREIFLSTALMGCVPEHPFMGKVIDKVFGDFQKLKFTTLDNKGKECLKTTGPLMVTELYEQLSEGEKKNVSPIPAEYLSPFDKDDLLKYEKGEDMDILEQKIEKAYAVHYFFNSWLRGANYFT